MTKKMNHLAAKQWAEERDRQRAEEIDCANIAHDLAKLQEFRDFLIHKKLSGVPAQNLIDAIDDHAEKLTGNRETLWAKDARHITSRGPS